ncbi:MAG: WD40 repeat domain-containing protein [Planctomycetaceae bacterium]|jgi:WD40 repeat protein|nr:WD40 repeat domain-containing protein [Planctomycetaceae bacterium]
MTNKNLFLTSLSIFIVLIIINCGHNNIVAETATVFNVPDEVITLEGHTREIDSAVFSHDSKKIVTASWDKTARIWDTATGKELQKLKGHPGKIISAFFSFNGKTIVTASWDSTTRIWDVSTGKELQKLERDTEENLSHATDNFSHTAVFSPDGEIFITLNVEDNTARIYDTATGKELQKLEGHTNAVQSAVFSPDGKMIVTASWDKTARIWNRQKIQQHEK